MSIMQKMKSIVKKNNLHYEPVEKTKFDSKSSISIKQTYNDIPMNVPADYQKTIFLYSQRKTSLKQSEKYQRYLTYTLGITNPYEYHKQLIEEGYFRQARTEEIIQLLTVSDIKTLLKQANQPVSGKKADLIQRLYRSVPEQQIRQLVPSSIYALSEKGIEYLNLHADYIQLWKHKNWDISIEAYLDAKQKLSSSMKFNDIAWNIFNEMLIASDDAGKLSVFRHKHDLLLEENRPDQALFFLLVELYYELSGAIMELSISMYQKYKMLHLSEYYNLDNLREAWIPPELAIYSKRIGELKNYYTEQMADKICMNYHPHVHICSPALFKRIVKDLIENGTESAEQYIPELKKMYIEYICKL